MSHVSLKGMLDPEAEDVNEEDLFKAKMELRKRRWENMKLRVDPVYKRQVEVQAKIKEKS